jgi:hypothetical protein
VFFNVLIFGAFFLPIAAKLFAYFSIGAAQGADALANLTLRACDNDNCRQSFVWIEILGGAFAPWIMGATIFLLIYNFWRLQVTGRASALAEQEVRSGRASEIGDYFFLHVAKRAFDFLRVFAVLFAAFNLWSWLKQPLTIVVG